MNYIAIVGRPNVGKSTLFNKIAGGRPAIVDDTPGVTRDRNIATVEWNERTFGVIDSGGFEPEAKNNIEAQIKEQAQMAIEEAEVIIYVVDGKEGITPLDGDIARYLRKAGKPIFLAVNKIDNPKHEESVHDFTRLGFPEIRQISAEHSLGVRELINDAAALLPATPAEEPAEEDEERPLKISVIGKPNVGKSSLVNRVLGTERMMVSEVAGTTRDAIDTEFIHEGRKYILIDTAGIRRKSKVTQKLEKFSVIMAMKAIERADVALLLIDASDGVAAQEAKIGGLLDGAGKGCIIVVNKWDAVEKDDKTALIYEEAIRNQLKFLSWAPMVFVSSLTGQRLDRIWDAVDLVHKDYMKRIGSGALNTLMDKITATKQPPIYRNKRTKIYYVTQVSVAPPTFVFMTNQPKGVHFSYRRYLVNQIRTGGGFEHTPIKLIFRKPAGRRTNK